MFKTKLCVPACANDSVSIHAICNHITCLRLHAFSSLLLFSFSCIPLWSLILSLRMPTFDRALSFSVGLLHISTVLRTVFFSCSLFLVPILIVIECLVAALLQLHIHTQFNISNIDWNNLYCKYMYLLCAFGHFNLHIHVTKVSTGCKSDNNEPAIVTATGEFE